MDYLFTFTVTITIGCHTLTYLKWRIFLGTISTAPCKCLALHLRHINGRRVLSVASETFQRSSDFNLCLWKGHLFFHSEDETTREYLYHNQCFNITVQWQCSFTMLSIPIRWTPYYFRFSKTKLILSGKHPSKRWHSWCDSKFNLFSVIFIKVENHKRKL